MVVEVLDNNYHPKLTIEEGNREFSDLCRLIKQKGLMDRSYVYYIWLMLCYFSIWCLLCYAIYTTTNYGWLILESLVMGFTTFQIAGIMHDAAHGAIFKSYAGNAITGIIFGFLIGANFYGWSITHNHHHKHANKMDVDTDVDALFSFTKQGYLSKDKGILRFFRKYQSWLFFPTTCLVFYTFHYKRNNFSTLKQHEKNRWRLALKITLSCLALFYWYVLPFVLFPVAKALLILLIVNSVAGFYLTIAFFPAHNVMPKLGEGVEISVLEHQIITSLNLKPGPLCDFIYVGTNYHIEHHLFDSCARNKLKKIAPYVRELCERLDLPYTLISPLKSIELMIIELNETSHECEKELITGS